jgi:hypothetical protein
MVPHHKQPGNSVEKLNAVDFKPGDSVLFEGGSVFSGTIKLMSDDNGTAAYPVVLSSYGNGKAIIDAGDGDGLLAINTSFLKIQSLSFTGSGVNKNNGNGIHFFAKDSLTAPTNIEITGCDIKASILMASRSVPMTISLIRAISKSA